MTKASEHTEPIQLGLINAQSDDKTDKNAIRGSCHVSDGSGELAEVRELEERHGGHEREHEKGRLRKNGEEGAERW